jgi:hypothetical protein
LAFHHGRLRAVAVALTQVSFDRFGFIRLQWMLARVATLKPMNHDAQRFEIEVLDAQQPNLAGSQTMAVGEQKDRFVPSVRCKSMEQAGSLLEREKLDRPSPA